MNQRNLYDKDEAVKLYLGGQSADQVGKQFGVSGTAIRQVLRKRGIECRQDHCQPKLPPDKELELCQRYVAGELPKNLAPQYSIAFGSVFKVLRRQGYEVRGMSESKRRYVHNRAFFEKIDTESKAYWLGFIAADGYIRKAAGNVSPELVVSLATVDRGHLVKLKDALQSSHPIREYDYSAISEKNRPYASFSVRSRELATGLKRFGIVPAKTFTLRWPTLPDELLRHYLRGIFDGDGVWHIKNGYRNGRQMNWRKDIAFRLTSNREFLIGCQHYLVRACDLRYTKLSERQDKWKGTVPTLIYSGRNQVSRIYHLMYDDATIYLPRKKQKAEPHII